MSKRGLIVLVPFPFSDLSGDKVRPALVVAHPRRADDLIVAFISSQTKDKHLGPVDIALGQSHSSFEQSGLKIDSVIKLAKLATLEQKIVLGELGNINDQLQKEVDKKLLSLFNL